MQYASEKVCVGMDGDVNKQGEVMRLEEKCRTLEELTKDLYDEYHEENIRANTLQIKLNYTTNMLGFAANTIRMMDAQLQNQGAMYQAIRRIEDYIKINHNQGSSAEFTENFSNATKERIRIQKTYNVKLTLDLVQIKKSPDCQDSWGVFTNKKIEKGTVITFFDGPTIIRHRKKGKRKRLSTHWIVIGKNSSNAPVLQGYTSDDIKAIMSSKSDAEVAATGFGSICNSAVESNAFFKLASNNRCEGIISHGNETVNSVQLLVAKRDIMPYEEILVNYRI